MVAASRAGPALCLRTKSAYSADVSIWAVNRRARLPYEPHPAGPDASGRQQCSGGDKRGRCPMTITGATFGARDWFGR